jgi:hypothetical protein
MVLNLKMPHGYVNIQPLWLNSFIFEGISIFKNNLHPLKKSHRVLALKDVRLLKEDEKVSKYNEN